MTHHHAVVLLAVANALHLGFQAVVTVLVYPTLARTAAAEWAEVHDRHSRTITPLVVVVYSSLAVGVVAALLTGPGVLEVVACVAVLVVVLVTAAVAGPTHGRLASPDSALLRRLLVSDRLRLAGAVVAAVAALVAVLAG